MSPWLKGSESVKISLISPNEAKKLIEKERRRRKLIRLQQMREQDRIRSQITGHIMREMKDDLMKAVAENIAESVRKAYRIEVVPVASTSREKTPTPTQKLSKTSLNGSRTREVKTGKTPLKRLQRLSTTRTPVAAKTPSCRHKHKRCLACNPNAK